MSVGTALSRATGMLRLTAAAAALGYTALADTYNTANTTPNIVYELVLGGILTSIFVPVFVQWTQTHGRDESWRVAERMMTIALVVLSAIAAIAAAFAPAIMRLYLSAAHGGADPGQVALGAEFLRWFMPQIVFYGVGAVAIGVLQASRRFAVPMFAPVLNNLAVIATMVAFIAITSGAPRPAELSFAQRTLLAAGTTFGVAAMTLALWPSLRRLGFRWRLRFDWRHESVGAVLSLARWTVLYVVANQLAYLLVIVLNNRLGPGNYTAYMQAFIFFQLPHAIFGVSIFTALLPSMAEEWTNGATEHVRVLWSKGARSTLAIMVPAALGYVVLAEPIVRLFAAYGAATPPGIDLVASALRGFAIGLPFFSAFQLLTRTFYATQDARTPALVNVVAASVNAATNVLLTVVLGLGVGALAIGHAVSYVAGTALLAWILRRRLGGIDGRRIAAAMGRVLPPAIACAAVALGTAALVGRLLGVGGAPQRLVQVLLAILAGLLAFWGGAVIFGVREVDEVRSALQRRFRR